MKVDKKQLEFIQKICDAPGASGFEDEVVKVAREALEGFRLEEDCMRNLYIYRKEHSGNKPVVMLDAHSDEVGFVVHSIKPSGCLRFVPDGGWSTSGLPSSKVLVRNALGEYIPGIIALKPVHFMSAAEKTAASGIDISSLVIDIGARSAEEAAEKFHIRIGEPIVPCARFEYDKKNDVMFGKAFDCRIGCAALVETMKRLDGLDLPFDVVGVLSSQEEVGERGCSVAVGKVRPDIAIAFEGCPADDTFTEPYAIQTALKKGPMLRHIDKSIICSPRFQRFVLDLAAKKKLAVQESVREGGGNNGAIIQRSYEAVPVIVAGVPVRYIHTMNCITSYFDYEATVELAVETVKALTPEIVKGF